MSGPYSDFSSNGATAAFAFSNNEINTVTHGYRSSNEFIDFLKGYDDSGNCNKNVNCPDGDDWEYQKRTC